MAETENLVLRIEELEAELAKQQESQVNFVRSVTHSLKNSLGLVTNFAQIALLDADHTDLDDLQDSLKTVTKNANIALYIVEELRLWSGVRNKPEADMGSYALRPILDDVWVYCDDLVYFGRAQLQFVAKNPESEVLGDKPFIHQVLLSVIAYLLKQGVRPNRIVCEIVDSDKQVIVSISGDFDREFDIDNLFAVDEKSILKTDGYGLGLPFAKELMGLMNGALFCREPENGRLQFDLKFSI